MDWNSKDSQNALNVAFCPTSISNPLPKINKYFISHVMDVKSRSEATVHKPVEKPVSKMDTYSEWQLGTTRVSVQLNDGVFDRFVPKDVSRYFEDEFDYRFVGNWKELTNLAMAYFTMLAAPEVSVSGGGGSTGNDLKWGRDPREDEMKWSHRCAQAAIKALGKQARYGRRR